MTEYALVMNPVNIYLKTYRQKKSTFNIFAFRVHVNVKRSDSSEPVGW